MDVATSAGPTTSREALQDESVPSNDRPKAVLVSTTADGRLDGDTVLRIMDVGGQNEKKLSQASFHSLAIAGSHAESQGESVSKDVRGIGHESLSTASKITECSDLRVAPNNDRQAYLPCEDAELSLDKEQNSARSNVCMADDNLDLEKGVSEARSESQKDSHGSNCIKSIVLEKLDRNGSSAERVCRVCYMNLAAQPENGPAIELGCDCKHDLALAHRQCAEAWFKIKGNRICEICGSTVKNVSGINESTFMENWNDGNSRPDPTSERERCWQNHRLFNVLLACMVFAFVLPWLFHVSALFK